jgi:hypothetical protein
MIGKDELINFKKMWTWLSGYPAHDRVYYMKNVAKLDTMWMRDCPLATSADDDCDGCRTLWQSETGSMCTDVDSPLYKWQHTSRQRPDDRSYYASHIAVIAMNALKNMGEMDSTAKSSPEDYVDAQLHG